MRKRMNYKPVSPVYINGETYNASSMRTTYRRVKSMPISKPQATNHPIVPTFDPVATLPTLLGRLGIPFDPHDTTIQRDDLWEYHTVPFQKLAKKYMKTLSGYSGRLTHRVKGLPMGGDPDVYRITIMKPRGGATSVDDLVGRLLPSLTLHQYLQTATVTAGDTSILKGRSCIAPFYFAGWDSALSIFVICSSDLSRVPEFGLDEYVSKTSPAHPRIILAVSWYREDRMESRVFRGGLGELPLDQRWEQWDGWWPVAWRWA
jgi:hypothetical protein